MFSSKQVDDRECLCWYVHFSMRIYVIKEKTSFPVVDHPSRFEPKLIEFE